MNCGIAVLAHHLLHVGPHRVGALGEDPVALVEHLVEDLDALVGQPDLVGVGVHQRPPDLDGVPVLDDGVQLAADVLDRLGDRRQARLQAGEQGLGHDETLRVLGGQGTRVRTTLTACTPCAHRSPSTAAGSSRAAPRWWWTVTGSSASRRSAATSPRLHARVVRRNGAAGADQRAHPSRGGGHARVVGAGGGGHRRRDRRVDRAVPASQVRAGVTTVRDLGDRHYRTVVARDRATPGLPRIVAAGPPITAPGGHCHYLGGEASGLDGIRAALDERRERGVDVVKVMAAGGMLTQGTDIFGVQFYTGRAAGAGGGRRTRPTWPSWPTRTRWRVSSMRWPPASTASSTSPASPRAASGSRTRCWREPPPPA